jgi:signal transduction histidine kinase
LHHLGEQLESMIGPTDILSAIIRAIRESLRVPYAAVALQRLDLDALDGEAQILTVAPDERENPPNSDTLVTIPVTHLGQTVGALLVDTCDEDRCLNEDDLATLRVFAGQAGAAVHIVQLMEDLRRTRERLVLAREEERQRLRRNLHDVVGPTLTALMFRAGVLRRLIHENPPAAEAQMGEYHDQLKTVLTEVRRVVYNLRPPALDEIGMLRAIRELASQFCTEALTVEVDAPDFLPALHPAIEVAAYRIASEGMLNVARHAQATRCFVRLRVSDAAFLVEVQDNGRGISPGAAIGVGLASMRERARELGGLLDVHTTPGAGTHLIACLPMNLNSWVNLAAETKTLHLQPA